MAAPTQTWARHKQESAREERNLTEWYMPTAECPLLLISSGVGLCSIVLGTADQERRSKAQSKNLTDGVDLSPATVSVATVSVATVILYF